jgi:hypothetical protein
MSTSARADDRRPGVSGVPGKRVILIDAFESWPCSGALAPVKRCVAEHSEALTNWSCVFDVAAV